MRAGAFLTKTGTQAHCYKAELINYDSYLFPKS